MKHYIFPIILALTLFIMLCFGGCSSTKVYIMGVDIDKITNDRNAIFGMVASFVTHWAGHYIAAELVGADIDQQGVREIITNSDELNDSDERWVARGGFLAQTLVNVALASFKSTRKLQFTKGYTIGTILEIGTYPLRWHNEGDLVYLKDRGGSDLEWILYTYTSPLVYELNN